MNEASTQTIHRLPLSRRVMVWLSYPLTAGMALLGLVLPRLLPGVATVYIGFGLAAVFGSMLLLMIVNPAAVEAERTEDGLAARIRGRNRFIARELITGVRERPMLGQVELLLSDGDVIPLSRHIRNLPLVLEHALERVAPATPHDFRTGPWIPGVSLLALMAVPASILSFGGVLMAAWVVAIFGLIALVYALRVVRLTPALVELRRPLTRQVIPLRSIVALRLALPDMEHLTTAVELLTREGEVVAIRLPPGRLLLFYAALNRELARIYGDEWKRGEELPPPEDEESMIAAALADFETGGTAEARAAETAGVPPPVDGAGSHG